jgi:hypothetical protein
MNESQWPERRRMGIAHAPDERYEEFVDRWAKEIGRFILAFGSIEYTTYMALQSFPRDPIGDPTSKLQLGDRIELLLAILGARTDANSPKLAENRKRAEQLARDLHQAYDAIRYSAKPKGE